MPLSAEIKKKIVLWLWQPGSFFLFRAAIFKKTFSLQNISSECFQRLLERWLPLKIFKKILLAKCQTNKIDGWLVVWLNRLKFLIISHHFAKFCSHRFSVSSDTIAKIVYVILQDHVGLRDQKIWWFYGRKLLVVYAHTDKTDSHRYCVNRYTIFFICHVIFQDHVIIWSCDFMGKSQPR